MKIEKESDGFFIRISKKEKGFNTGKDTFGNEINNMKKRIAEVDGQLFIRSVINKGTEIKVQFS